MTDKINRVCICGSLNGYNGLAVNSCTINHKTKFNYCKLIC